jgi:hypothetical protein
VHKWLAGQHQVRQTVEIDLQPHCDHNPKEKQWAQVGLQCQQYICLTRCLCAALQRVEGDLRRADPVCP